MFATPLRAVGVQGDERSYRNVAILDAGKPRSIAWPSVFESARKFTNGNPGFNRVIAPLSEIRVSDLKVNDVVHDANSVAFLREIDDVFVKAIVGEKISQGLVVLLPLGVSKKVSVVIRAIVTNDFMTGHAASPLKEFKRLMEVADSLVSKFADGIETVFYDVTNKPPATVEWL